MKHLSRALVATAVALWTAPTAQADPVGVGDIAVISIVGDSTGPTGDAFAWVPLINLDAGDMIFFTDSSWNTDVPNDFNGTEGAIKYTVPAGGIAAGTIFYVDVDALSGDYADAGTVDTGTESPLSISNNGDQIAVFTGSTAAPTFIFAVNSNANQWIFSANGATESNLYAGLTDGVNAVAVGAGSSAGNEFDNAYYTGPTSGNAATLLAAITNAANWAGQDDGSLLSTNLLTGGLGTNGGFTVDSTGGPGPDPGPNNPIPEPGTAVLLGLGLAALIVHRRRR